MEEAKYFEVRLKRSGCGRPDSQRRTLQGLGLSRFGKSVFLKDTVAVRGMLFKVVHLVDVFSRHGELPLSARGRARRAEKKN